MNPPNYISNPFQYLRIYHDVETKREVKKYEKISINVCCIKERLTFLHRCKIFDLTPRSLWVKPLVKSREGRQISRNSEKQFLSAAITKCHKDIDFLNNNISLLESSLFNKLDSQLYEVLKSHILQKTRIKKEKTKMNLIKKLDLLKTKKVKYSDDFGDYNKKWVLNLSKTSLTTSDLSLLSKGLNFAVSTKKYDVAEFLAPIERSICDIPEAQRNDIRLSVTSMLHFDKCKEGNLTKLERESLKKLKDDKSIIILPADKGRTTVVMDTEEYFKKVDDLLQDDTTYEEVKCDPTKKLQSKLNNFLLDLYKKKLIHKSIYDSLRCTSGSIPRFYGVPKIHKVGVPLRPIVSFVSSPFYNISKYLSRLLYPYSLNKYSTLTSSTFSHEIRNKTLERDEMFASFDVVSLFTCIPTTLACEAAFKALSNDSNLHHRTDLPPEIIRDMLSFCLSSTTFVCRNRFYKQKFGTAMGSPVSPVVANLVMDTIEKTALETFRNGPSFWTRYVDDVFCIIEEAKCDEFLIHLNSINPYLKFTLEKELNKSISFLDVCVKHDSNGKIFTSVYRKNTCTDRLLDFNSNHPITHKISTVKTLYKRAEMIPSTLEAKLTEKSHLDMIFSKNNYPNWFVNQHKAAPAPSVSSKEDNQKSFTVIPYIKGISEPVRRILKKHNINCCFKPGKKLREILSHPKDIIPMDSKSSVVYTIPCKDCEKWYVGQTKRHLGTRIKEHKICVRNGDSLKSSIALHNIETKHNINWDDKRILHKSINTRDRLFLEGWEIENGTVFEKNRGMAIPSLYKPLQSKIKG